MPFLHRYALSFLLLASLSTALQAQPTPQESEVPPFDATGARFEPAINVADGLPEHSVGTMLQDHLGFLWFGTANGLVRYDGRALTVFQPAPDDPYSFGGRIITVLHEDREGDLWIGTALNGLVHYDRATGRFTTYRHDPADETSLSMSAVRMIHEDPSGDIWVVTPNDNLDRLDRATGTFTRFRHDPNDATTLANDRVGAKPARLGPYLPALVEDASGTLWIGTTDGLCRYDPETESFTTYRPYPNDDFTTGRNWISELEATRDGRLWVPTRFGGLNRFDPKTETFTHLPKNPADPHGLATGGDGELYEDQRGIVWLSQHGLSRFDPETETFTYLPPDADDPRRPGHDRMLARLEDEAGIWFFAGEHAVEYYDRASGTFTPMTLGPDVLSMMEDRSGSVWVGLAGGGVHKLDRTIRFPQVTYDEEDPQGLSDFHIRVLYEAPSEPGIVWVGTERGLNRFDRATGRITRYRHDPRDARSISSDTVQAVLEDPTGRLWVGTERGFNRMDRATGQFTAYHRDRRDAGSLLFDDVEELAATPDGALWIGTSRGLDRFDPDTESFTHYTATLDTLYHPELYRAAKKLATQRLPLASILAEEVTSDRTQFFDVEERAEVFVLAQGEFGNVSGRGLDYGWIEDEAGSVVWEMTLADSRHAGGARLYRAQAGLLTLEPGRYRLRYVADQGMGYGDWGSPVPDHPDPELWGIQVLPVTATEADTLTSLLTKTDTNRLSGYDVEVLSVDRDGVLWIGLNGGLNRFDPTTGTFTVYADPVTGPTLVRAIHQDQAGHLWVGDYIGGLYRIDPDSGLVAQYTAAHGLPGSGVWSILEDDEGYLWIGDSGRGLSRFDPETETFRAYGAKLTGDLNGAAVKSADGTLILGSFGEFTLLDPRRLADDPHPPEVALAGFDLFNEPAAIGPEAVLKQDISVAEQITLAHNQNDFTLHFAALHYANPEENTVRYRLDPYDTDWVEAGAARQARYTNLSPGSYTFRVIAANPDGIWNEEGRSLSITILPPWWKTWWAYAIYGLLVLGGVFAVDRRQRRRLIAREREAARERELEQAREIEKAHGELQQAHTHLKATQAQLVLQEKMASLGALTAGIAHEIKNPLNFVNNFSEIVVELSDELKDLLSPHLDDILRNEADDFRMILSDLGTNAEAITKHGKRADGIVHAMMQHASGGTGQREATEVNALVSEHIELAYHGKRAQMMGFNPTIERDLDAGVGAVEMVPQEIGRVLLNLLGNAFDAVHERAQAGEGAYTPTVTVSTRRNGEAVEIRVADNGPGIDTALREKIFEPFFTTKPTGSGTGLGLSLSYDIVTQGHGGMLTVESEAGQGAAFVVTLPDKKR